MCQDRSKHLDPDQPLLAEPQQPPLDHGELPEGQAGKGDEDLGSGEREAQKKLVEIEAEAGVLGDQVSDKVKNASRRHLTKKFTQIALYTLKRKETSQIESFT